MKESIDPLLNGEGQQKIDDTEKAEVFNAFFTSVFTKEVNCDQTLNIVNINNRGEGSQNQRLDQRKNSLKNTEAGST